MLVSEACIQNHFIDDQITKDGIGHQYGLSLHTHEGFYLLVTWAYVQRLFTCDQNTKAVWCFNIGHAGTPQFVTVSFGISCKKCRTTMMIDNDDRQ